MPKKKTIPPPDDFSSEFMETEFVKELSEQQAEAADSDNTETPLAEPPEVDLGSGDVSGTADVGEKEPDAENTADAADTVPVSDEKAEDPEYDSILQELNSSTPAPLDSSGENDLDEVAQTLGVSAEKAAQLIGCKTNALPVSALSDTDPDDDPLAWLLLDQHALTPEQAVYRQVCTEELEQLFRTLSAKDRAILGHTYGVFGYSCISLNLFWKPDSISFTRSFAGCTSVMSANLRRRFHRLFRFF